MRIKSLFHKLTKLPWRKALVFAYVAYNFIAPMSAIPAVLAVGYDECVGTGVGCHATLQDAITAASPGDTIALTSDITVASRADLNNGMTLEGNGHTIFASFDKTSNSNNAALGVFGNGVTIQNLIVDGTGSKPWPLQLHGINVYQATNVYISNVTVKNFSGSGIVVNNSDVTVNNITTLANAWHGINVDNKPASLTVNGTSTHTDALPIFIDNSADLNNGITIIDTLSQYNATIVGGSYLFTLVDNTPPAVPTGLHIKDHNGVDLGCGGYTNNRTITVDWNDNTTDSDFAYFLYDIKDRDGLRQLTTSEVTGQIRDLDGEYKYKIRAVDTTGNISAASEWCSVTLDRVAPDQALLKSPVDGAYVNGSSLTQSWYPVDGAVSYDYESYNDASLTSLRWSDNYTSTSKTAYNVGESTYYWRIRAVDSAGNVGAWSDAWQIAVDNTGPVAPTILSPDSEDAFNSTPILNDWTDVTDLSGISKYRVQYEYDDGHTFSGYPYRETTVSQRNHTPGLSEEGGVKYRVQAFDGAGNEGTWSEWTHYYYDLTAPVTTFTAPTDGAAFKTGFDITGTTEDEVGVSSVILSYKLSSDSTWTEMITGTNLVNLSGSKVYNWSQNWTPTTNGQYDLMAKAYDTAGNLESTAYVYGVYFDTSKPAISIDSPSIDTYHNGDVEVIGTASDSVSDIDHIKVKLVNEDTGKICKTGGKAWRNASYDNVTNSWSYTLPKGDCEDGYYLVKAKAWDLAGNKKKASTHVYLDTTPPAKPVMDGFYINGSSEITSCGGYTNSNNINVEWTLNSEDDVASYWFGNVNSAYRSNWTHPTNNKDVTMTVGKDEYYYTIIAVDKAGNESEISNPCYVNLDMGKPEISSVTANGLPLQENYYEGDDFPMVDVSANDVEGNLDKICFSIEGPVGVEGYDFVNITDIIGEQCYTVDESLSNGWGIGDDSDFTWQFDPANIIEDFAYFDTALLHEGDYTFKYQVFDKASNMSDLSETVVTLNNVAPALTFGNDQTIVEGSNAIFTGSFTDPSYIEDYGPGIHPANYTPIDSDPLKPDDSVWTAYITYGDEDAVYYKDFILPGDIDFPDHIYVSNGEYKAIAVVCESVYTSDEDLNADSFKTTQKVATVNNTEVYPWEKGEGECDVKYATVTVSDLTPTVVITSNQPATVTIGTTVTLTANPAGGNAPYTYNWTGDCTGTSQTAVVNANTVRDYSCTAEVTDVDGDVTSDTYAFTANTPFLPVFQVLGAQDEAEKTSDETQATDENGEIKGETCTETMISGYVYVDENSDEKMNDGEKVFQGVIVTLIDADGKEVGTVKTDKNGYYEFTSCEGKYTLNIDESTVDDGYEVLGASTDVDTSDGESNVDFMVKESKTLMDYWWVLLLVVVLVGGTGWFVSRRKEA